MVSSRSGKRQRRVVSQYTVDDLAEQTGLTARTIRSYQTQGLLPVPERHGRVAYYDYSHVERLEEIAELKEDGLSLASIQDLLTRREAETRTKASRARARTKAEPSPPSPVPEVADPGEVAESAPATRTGAFTPETRFVGTTRVPLLGVDSEAKTQAKSGDSKPGQTAYAERPRRRRGLIAAMILGLLLTVAAVSSVIAVLSLSGADNDREKLGRQVSDLQNDLSRLDGNQGPPVTVVVPGPVQQVPVPQTSAPTADPATRTVVVTTPRQAPAAPAATPPAAAPASPPTPPPCTLDLLGLCVP